MFRFQREGGVARGWGLQDSHFLYVAECLDKLKPVIFD